ncbi:MAG: phosphoribosyltransferase family protein [Candidatus Bathyarchaeia archaeon]
MALKAISHAHDLKFRLMTVDLLRLAKKRFTYRKLSQLVGLQVTVLSRYVKGHVLPSSDRAVKMWAALSPVVGLEHELWARVKFDEHGYFDNTGIIGSSTLLQMAAQDALGKFAGRRVTKVLTAAVDGIPLGTMVAQAVSVDLVIAKGAKEVGVPEFVEETYIPEDTGMMIAFYVPKGAIKRGESVLIVDDVIRTGYTQNALINLVQKCRAEPAGVYALVAIGDDAESKVHAPPECKVETVIKVKPKPPVTQA